MQEPDDESECQRWLKEREEERAGKGIYGWALDTAFPSEADRADFFERLMLGKVPTITHISIAQLARYGRVSAILTTNFDRLMEYAMLQNGGIMPCVSLAHDPAARLNTQSHRVKILKLHGDYLYRNIQNLEHELYRVRDSMAAKLALAAKEPILIVAGYGGGDTSVREVLGELLRDQSNFWHAIFWLQVPGDPAKPEVIRLLEAGGRRTAGFVEVESSDRFFDRLLHALPQGADGFPSLPRDSHHLLLESEEQRHRFVEVRLEQPLALDFLSSLKKRSDLALVGASAAGLDYLLARFDELGELPGNVGELLDRYVDLLGAGQSTATSRHARRVEQIQALGLGQEGAELGAAERWERYLEAVRLGESVFPFKDVERMIANEETYEVLRFLVGLVHDATGIIQSAISPAALSVSLCGRVQPWPEAIYKAAALCGAAGSVDGQLVERLTDWLSLELESERWFPEAAMRTLASMGAATIEPMMELLLDELNDLFTREDAALVLGMIGTKWTIDRLMREGLHSDAALTKLLIFALGKTDNPSAIDGVISLAKKVPPSSRDLVHKSLESLGYAGDPVTPTGEEPTPCRREHQSPGNVLRRYASGIDDGTCAAIMRQLWRDRGRGLLSAFAANGWPPDLKELMANGHSLRDAGELHEAEILFTECLTRYPMLPMCYHNLALIYSRQDRLYLARRCYSVGMEFEPDYADYYSDFASAMIRLGNMEAARSLIVPGLLRSQDNYRLWLNLAYVNLADGQTTPGEQLQKTTTAGGGQRYTGHFEWDPSQWETNVCMRQLVHLNPEHPFAREWSKMITELTGLPPTVPTPSELLEVLHLRQYKIPDRVALESLSAQARIGLEQFTLCRRNNDLTGALRALQDAYKECPDCAEIAHDLSALLTVMGCHDEAISIQEPALEKEPGSLDLMMNYFYTLLDASRFEDAERVARQGVQMRPNSAVSWFMLAEAYKAREKTAAAREAAQQATRLAEPWAWCMVRGITVLEQLGLNVRGNPKS